MPKSLRMTSILKIKNNLNVNVELISKWQLILFNIILFLYQFEFISNEGSGVTLSVFRIGIMPLLFLLFILLKKSIYSKDIHKLMIFFIFIAFEIITNIGFGDFSVMSSIFGNVLQFIVAYFYFKQNKIEKSSLLVLATWGIFQLPFFISDLITGNLGLANRFMGFHWDPNYLCMSLLISFWAKIYLLHSHLPKKLKVIILSLSVFDVLMILFSLSRGGLLALILTTLFYTFFNYRKLFYLILLSSVSLIGYMIERSQWLVWSDSLSLFDSIIYRTFTISETGDVSAGRLDFIDNYIYMLKRGEGIYFGVPLSYFIDNYNQGAYPHNAIVEILLKGGVLIGGTFCLLFVVQILKIIYLSFKSKVLSYEFLFIISGLSVLMFLSIGLKISWLFIGLIFSISNKKGFKKIISL